MRRLLPPGSAVVAVRGSSTETVLNGSYTQIFFEELPPSAHRSAVEGRYVILRGRSPARWGEVAVAPKVLDAFGLRIGDELRLPRVHLRLRVVGEAVHPEDLSWPLAVVVARQLNGKVQVLSRMIDLPPRADVAATAARLERNGIDVETRAGIGRLDRDVHLLVTAVTFGLGSLALLGTALIAAAAFLVGAIRQLRTLGLVGAIGGEPRHLRGVVLMGGVTLGLMGAAIGVAVGIGIAFAIHPALDALTNRLTGPLEIPWVELLGAIALGTVACAASAYLPARIAARVPTVEALAGRSPAPRRAGRLAGVGLGIVGVGILCLALATMQRSVRMVTGAVAITVAGFLLAIPLMVVWTGKLAGWFPMTLRLAARHTARHGRRTGAALAAATLALALPVAVSTITLSSEGYENQALPMADDQAYVGQFDTLSRPEAAAAIQTAIRARFPDATVGIVRWATFSPKRFPNVPPHTQVYAEGGVHGRDDGTSYQAGGAVAVASPDLLRSLHAEAGIERIGTVPILGLGRGSTDGGRVQLIDPSSGAPSATRRIRAEEIATPRYLFEMFPRYLTAPDQARRLGFVPRAGGLVVRFRDRPDGSSVAALRDIVSSHTGFFTQSNADYVSNAGRVRRLLGFGSALIAILVLSVAVALVGAESRRDNAILVAVGAEPRIRRRLVGANALLLGVLAGLLAIPTGFIPASVIQLVRSASYPVVIPWESWFVVAVLTPLVTAALVALATPPARPSALLHPAY
jgi:putative ABC transport system permease protein